uniref:AsIV-cont00093-ORF1 n=1 Tax=Apophua simplicipes ichnovirus TaxID=1329648 RepID=S5DT35_9VIRU|nr:AsIV-cont00093-ORF1 [Apophua simplicipes ichnovirus]
MSCYCCITTACYCSQVTTPIASPPITAQSSMSVRAFGVFDESWEWAQKVKLPNSCRATSLNSYEEFAHYLDGFIAKEKFIVTPTPDSDKIDDFIDMILEQNTKIIVMPGALTLNGAEKRYCYWNTLPENSPLDSKYKLKLDNLSFRKLYSIFDVTIQSRKSGKKYHTVKIFQFTMWLDIGIPIGTRYFGAFIEEVNVANGTDFTSKETPSPIIVHCNNLGYAETFCALDTCMEKWILTREIDTNTIINRVRQGPYTKNFNRYQSIFVLEAITEFASIIH